MTTIQITKQIAQLHRQVSSLQNQVDLLSGIIVVKSTNRVTQSQRSIWKSTAGILKRKLKNVDPVKLQRQWRSEWDRRYSSFLKCNISNLQC